MQQAPLPQTEILVRSVCHARLAHAHLICFRPIICPSASYCPLAISSTHDHLTPRCVVRTAVYLGYPSGVRGRCPRLCLPRIIATNAPCEVPMHWSPIPMHWSPIPVPRASGLIAASCALHIPVTPDVSPVRHRVRSPARGDAYLAEAPQGIAAHGSHVSSGRRTEGERRGSAWRNVDGDIGRGVGVRNVQARHE